MNRRIETKVIAGGLGASALAGLILGTLGVTVFGVPFDADHAQAAIDSVPSWLALPVSGIAALVAGWLAPRTSDAERGITTDPPPPHASDDPAAPDA